MIDNKTVTITSADSQIQMLTIAHWLLSTAATAPLAIIFFLNL